MPTFNNHEKTMDGKPITYKAMHLEIERLLNEGCDVTMTDGQNTWTVPGRKTATKTTDGRDEETVDDQMTMTVEQTVTDDGQTATKNVDEDVVVASGDSTVTDERTLTTTVVEEVVMVEDLDPLACPASTSEVDPLACPASVSVADDESSAISHLSVVDGSFATPSTSGYAKREVQKSNDSDDIADSGKSASTTGKRVAGRTRAVILDDDDDTETAASIVSISSADEDSSMATSSSLARKSKGVKRRREPVKKKGKEEEGSSGERKKTKKGKRKVERKDTPEKEEEVGRDGEPKGIVSHVLEDMSSDVLGGAIQEWADMIEDVRAKSKNMQGRLSGTIKKCVAQIKEGAALLVVRSVATGDSQFVRLRNTELVAQLREAERENARLQEQLRRKNLEASTPPYKKKESVVKDVVVVPDPVDPPVREEFPPLPQRLPREIQDGGKKKKVGLRIVSDVQVAPPFKERRKGEVTASEASGSEAQWRVAAGSKRKGRIKVDKSLLPPPPPPPRPPIPGEGRTPAGQQQQPKVRIPKPPASSAVTITGRSEEFSYKDALRNARQHIKLETLGITVTRVKKAINGGVLIEVSGEDSRTKAEELVTRLRNVFKDTAAVACPTKKRELNVVGFDESVTAEEIMEALSEVGGCPKTDIRMGPIRTLNSGMGMVWVQLPVAAAAKVAEVGKVRVGWTIARVELLKVRPLQCYKCWSFGHVQNVCKSIVDRRGACFRCGKKGHVASTCANVVNCAVCHDAGLESSHRMGGPQCVARERQGEKK